MSFTVVLKVFGLVMAAFVALFAGIIGFLFATGGFNPPHIPLEGLYFEYSEFTIDEDAEIFVLPMPENSTELDIELSILTGNSIISVSQTAKMNEPILVEVLKDAYDKNIGGVARIRANQGLYVAEATIFVDVPVESFQIASSKAGGLYVGDTFTVSPTNIFPQYSLNPTILNQNYNKSDKVIKYYSSDTDIATVNELTGAVTLLEEGEFTIQARVIKTYNLDVTQKTLDDFIQEAIDAGEDTMYAQDDYNDYMDSISVVVERTFTVESIAVAGIEVNNNSEDPLYELDLHETHYFTPSELGVRLLPQPDSNFTSEQLEYKLKDIEVTSMHKNILGEFVENPNITVIPLEDPLRYEITVVEFETWETYRPYLLFYYSDEYQAVVHFKVLRNDIESITIEENAQNAIEVVLEEGASQTFDLEENTIINPFDPTKAPTYTKLIYRVDSASAKNDLDELIIDIDEETYYVTNNIITPLSRGTTRLKALVVETDIDGNAILDNDENYNIIFEMPEYVTVNVLEQLTELSAVIKKPKQQTITMGSQLIIEIENFYSSDVYTQILDLYDDIDILQQTDTTGYTAQELEGHNNQIIALQEQIDELKEERHISLADDNVVDITSTELIENTLIVNLETAGTGTVNLFIINTQTKIFTDYVEIEVTSGTAATEPVIFEFDLEDQVKTDLIRGAEGFLAFTPNSYGAFTDAYKYDKLEFVSVNSNMIQIYGSIDANNNIIVKLVAVGFDPNPEFSFSMIRARFVDAPSGDYLFNQRVNVDIGAVNNIYLHVNSTNIKAVPDEEGTQWLTQEDDEPLSVYVTFSEPDEPAVIGVQYISSDTSILEIDNNIIDEDGNPKFTFKREGSVTLTAKSLDPYAIPTDPQDPAAGAYSSVVLNVTVPDVEHRFKYASSTTPEEIVAGDEIDLLLPEIDEGGELKPRVQVMRDEGGDPQFNTVDYTSLVMFELEILTPGAELAASLQDFPAIENPQTDRRVIISTQPVGVDVSARVRVYTDFGWEEFYDILIVKNIVATLTYPDSGNLPEVIYPSTQEPVIIDLLAGRVIIEDLEGVQIPVEDINFEISNENYGLVDQDGLVTIWSTAVERELYVRIYIEFASGVDFESFYQIEVRPNIEIIVDYSNAVTHGDYDYEQISFTTSFDLIAEGKVFAQTVDPSIDPAQDISDELRFTKVGDSPINVSEEGVLTYSGTEDAYITIRIDTVSSDLQLTYRVKVLGAPA
jgi:hypothetical protein